MNFTYEAEEQGSLFVLDVLVRSNSDHFTTEVYVKATKLGFCLNGLSLSTLRGTRSLS